MHDIDRKKIFSISYKYICKMYDGTSIEVNTIEIIKLSSVCNKMHALVFTIIVNFDSLQTKGEKKEFAMVQYGVED